MPQRSTTLSTSCFSEAPDSGRMAHRHGCAGGSGGREIGRWRGDVEISQERRPERGWARHRLRALAQPRREAGIEESASAAALARRGHLARAAAVASRAAVGDVLSARRDRGGIARSLCVEQLGLDAAGTVVGLTPP